MHVCVVPEGDPHDPANFVAPIRLLDPLVALGRSRPITFEITRHLRRSISERAHLVLLQRACFSSSGEVDAAVAELRAVKREGVAVAWELDDHIFCAELPALIARNGIDEMDLEQYARTQAHRRLFTVVDAVICSTPALAQAVGRMTDAAVHVVPVRLDFSHRRWSRYRRRDAANRVTVGWCGGSRVGRDLDPLVPAVAAVMNRHAHVHFLYAGPDKYLPLFADLPRRRFHSHPWVPYHDYPRLLGSIDLGLAPLEDHAYNACKSPLKAIDFGAMGVPIVCSDVPAYQPPSESVWGRARDTSDWQRLIEQFIMGPPTPRVRQSIRRATRKRYDVRSGVKHHWAVLQALAQRP